MITAVLLNLVVGWYFGYGVHLIVETERDHDSESIPRARWR